MEENNRYSNNRGPHANERDSYPYNGNNYSNSKNSYSGNQNSYRNNGNGYQENRNGYPNNGNSYQGNRNGYSNNGNSYQGNRNSYPNNGNSYQGNRNGYPNNGNGYQGNRNGYLNNGNGYQGNRNGYPNNGNGYQGNRNGYPNNGNGYSNRGSMPYRENIYAGQQYRNPAVPARNKTVYYAVRPKRRIGPVIVVLVLMIAITGGAIAGWYLLQDRRTDEEKIRDCLTEFAAAYSVGDMNRLANCCDKNTRATLKAISAISLGRIGLGNAFQILFSMSSAGAGEDSVQIEVKNIEFNSDHTKATVDVVQTIITSVIGITNKEKYDDVAIMVKEDNDWKVLGSDF